jgi:excisionase family DNA binding protein
MPELYTFKQLCGLTDVSRRTLNRWLINGMLPFTPIRLGPRAIRFSKSDVLAWLDGQRQPRTG